MERVGKRDGKSVIKGRDGIEEKDTQDNSETVKIVHCQTAEKQPPSRQPNKHQP